VSPRAPARLFGLRTAARTPSLGADGVCPVSATRITLLPGPGRAATSHPSRPARPSDGALDAPAESTCAGTAVQDAIATASRVRSAVQRIAPAVTAQMIRTVGRLGD